MSFRSKMKGIRYSEAELRAWQRMNEKYGLHPNTSHIVPLKWTIPDFWFENTSLDKPLAVFFDGEEVHKDIDEDEWIARRLEGLNIKVLRYRYSGKMSDERLDKILAEIAQIVLGDRHEK